MAQTKVGQITILRNIPFPEKGWGSDPVSILKKTRAQELNTPSLFYTKGVVLCPKRDKK